MASCAAAGNELLFVRLAERVEQGVDVCAFEGDIDLQFNQPLRDVLRSKLNARCPALVLDFSGVTFIDSRGLATLFEYVRDAGEYGGVMCLAAVNDAVRPIFETVQFERVAPIYITVEEAAAALRAKTT